MNKDQNTLPGPVFEAGPGWGQRLGRWIKNNWTTKLFPAVTVIVLLAGIAKFYSHPQGQFVVTMPENSDSAPENKEIAVTVNKGDGVVALSRRALNEYLKEFPDISLKPEERLHVENFFQVKFRGETLAVGQEIRFRQADLQQAINEALKLSEGQRQKLRAYLQ